MGLWVCNVSWMFTRAVRRETCLVLMKNHFVPARGSLRTSLFGDHSIHSVSCSCWSADLRDSRARPCICTVEWPPPRAMFPSHQRGPHVTRSGSSTYEDLGPTAWTSFVDQRDDTPHSTKYIQRTLHPPCNLTVRGSSRGCQWAHPDQSWLAAGGALLLESLFLQTRQLGRYLQSTNFTTSLFLTRGVLRQLYPGRDEAKLPQALPHGSATVSRGHWYRRPLCRPSQAKQGMVAF